MDMNFCWSMDMNLGFYSANLTKLRFQIRSRLDSIDGPSHWLVVNKLATATGGQIELEPFRFFLLFDVLFGNLPYGKSPSLFGKSINEPFTSSQRPGPHAKAVDIMTNFSIRCFQNSSTTPRTGGDHTGAPAGGQLSHWSIWSIRSMVIFPIGGHHWSSFCQSLVWFFCNDLHQYNGLKVLGMQREQQQLLQRQ